MPTPPNMLRARTRGITRLSGSMTKVRKHELTGTRPDLQVFGVRLTDRAQAAGRQPAGASAAPCGIRWLVHKRTVPQKAGPASFKRLLGSASRNCVMARQY